MKEKLQKQRDQHEDGEKMKSTKKLSIVVAGIVFVISLFLLIYNEYDHANQKEMYEKLSEDYVTFLGKTTSELNEKLECEGNEASVVASKEEKEAKEQGKGSNSNEGLEEEQKQKNPGSVLEDVDQNSEHDRTLRPWYELARVDLEQLQQLNPDICGWILFENEEISYPILHGQNNNTYLRTNYRGEHVTAGSIFMESQNHADFSDAHTIIYGHNMKNETMFGKLKKYKNISGYYDAHQFFQIFMNNKICRYQIFAYKDVEVEDRIYQIFKENNQDFVNFVLNEISRDAMLDFSQENAEKVAENGHVITLSTCTSGEKRFIISAVKIDEISY